MSDKSSQSQSVRLSMAIASAVFFTAWGVWLLFFLLVDAPLALTLHTEGQRAEAVVERAERVSRDSPSRLISFRFKDAGGTTHYGEFVVPWYRKKAVGDTFEIAYLEDSPRTNAATGFALLLGPLIGGVGFVGCLAIAFFSVFFLLRERRRKDAVTVKAPDR